MESVKNAQIVVQGRVQGVGFRYHTLDKARELGIKGYVKNMPDGAVFIEAEGPESDLDTFMVWCRKGPGNARVDKIDITPGRVKNYPHFNIRH